MSNILRLLWGDKLNKTEKFSYSIQSSSEFKPPQPNRLKQDGALKQDRHRTSASEGKQYGEANQEHSALTVPRSRLDYCA